MTIPAPLKTLIWFRLGQLKPGRSRFEELDAAMREYLRPTNSELLDLRRRYDQVKRPAHSCWSIWERCIDLRRFRAENDYLSQAYFGRTLSRYRLTTAYVEAIDQDDWLHSLTEDGQIGAKLWRVDRERVVSRDLLDSILELCGLKEFLGGENNETVRVLDVGAGYGRFAHRFVHAFPTFQTAQSPVSTQSQPALSFAISTCATANVSGGQSFLSTESETLRRTGSPSQPTSIAGVRCPCPGCVSGWTSWPT
jgi:hypothetical protein